MITKSLKILVLFEFPTGDIRLWDGAGPFIDLDGNIWQGCALTDSLDVIECAINGEAYTLNLGVSGVDPRMGDLAWQDTEDGNVIGSTIRIMVQKCDQWDQPVGNPKIKFTGNIDNIVFSDSVVNDQQLASVMIECTNRFALRTLRSGSVLSDADQRARAARLNPSGNPDRFCERVPKLADAQRVWPRYT